jgi:hypothetical protein
MMLRIAVYVGDQPAALSIVFRLPAPKRMGKQAQKKIFPVISPMEDMIACAECQSPRPCHGVLPLPCVNGSELSYVCTKNSSPGSRCPAIPHDILSCRDGMECLRRKEYVVIPTKIPYTKKTF